MTGSADGSHAATQTLERPSDATLPAERPRRAILHLKSPPVRLAPPTKWKCKPCGTALEVRSDLAPTEIIRCPACNARLGRAEEFLSADPAPRVRARRA